MSFNLEARRRNTFLRKLRSLPGCEQVRPSDLDGLDEKELYDIFHGVKRDPKGLKTAIHGAGGTFNATDINFDPYQTSYLVNAKPEFGSNRRPAGTPKGLPGAGDMQINDDNDKQKFTRGEASDDDFNVSLKREKINDAMDAATGNKRYIVRFRLPENQQPTKERANELFGDGGQSDGTSVYVVIKGYKKALDIMNRMPGCVLEPC